MRGDRTIVEKKTQDIGIFGGLWYQWASVPYTEVTKQIGAITIPFKEISSIGKYRISNIDDLAMYDPYVKNAEWKLIIKLTDDTIYQITSPDGMILDRVANALYQLSKEAGGNPQLDSGK